jgi:hypothetical protein
MNRTAFRLLLFSGLTLVSTAISFGQSGTAKFDVPAMLEAHPIINDCVLPSDDPYEQLIEIVIPVSCWVEPQYRETLNEFRFDVFWQRSVYPMVEYAPKTLMQSPVSGLIAVEKREDQNVKLGGGTVVPTPSVTLNANAETNSHSGTTRRFEEVPEHEMLVASGSINRGTGAFFRFHSSKQYSLEGGREISLIYRVPKNWRGGVLRIDCLAQGTLKKFGGATEMISAQMTFVAPIYLQGDHTARQVAVRYVQSEQALRTAWHSYQTHKPQPTLIEQMQTAFKKNAETESLPNNWVVVAIQSASDQELQQAQKQKFPTQLRTAVSQFADARKMLTAISQ